MITQRAVLGGLLRPGRRAWRCPMEARGLVAGETNTSIGPRTAKEEVERHVALSLSRCFGVDAAASGPGPAIAVPPRLSLGDLQSNAAMPLAKRLRKAPLEVAEIIRKDLCDHGIASLVSNISLAGPGFINFRLSNEYIARKLRRMLLALISGKEPHDPASKRGPDPLLQDLRAMRSSRDPGVYRVLVDFSSPNIAKEMHVGHLRSTIIGDCLARLQEALGYDVLRINHVGDWGTQFGMLIHYLKQSRPDLFAKIVAKEQLASKSCSLLADTIEALDLVEFYKAARKDFDANSNDFQERSRLEVVALQNGDPNNTAVWKYFCSLSRQEFQKIYDTLNISIVERGESFYNPFLAGLLTDLTNAGLVVKSQGALIFKSEVDAVLPGVERKEIQSEDSKTPAKVEDPAMLLQKSDGGFLYATTDLAAAKYRFSRTGDAADRVLYVTDSGQGLHFKQLFGAARAAGFVPPGKELRHVPFGLVLGEDGKKMKSRSGETVRLSSLLKESVEHAEQVIRAKIAERSGGLDSAGPDAKAIRERAERLGIAAVKYADLSMNRESNYRFSPTKMMSLTGNTAPYILYALVRIRGIIKRIREESQQTGLIGAVVEGEEAWLDLDGYELELARKLIVFDDVLLDAHRALYPHKMCEYLFDLSQTFSSFYEACPVLLAGDPERRAVRTSLCLATEGVLQTYLCILGIDELDEL